MSTPKRVFAVNVNLFFREGLDTKKYGRELRALADAAESLAKISREQFASDVEGQEGVGEQSDVPAQAVYNGMDPKPLTGDQWMYQFPSSE